MLCGAAQCGWPVGVITYACLGAEDAQFEEEQLDLVVALLQLGEHFRLDLSAVS